MTSLQLPPAPANFATAPGNSAIHAAWLMEVARKCGEPALNHALGMGWPGTPMQRKNLHDSVIEECRNEARQLANEVHYRKLRAAGKWGV